MGVYARMELTTGENSCTFCCSRKRESGTDAVLSILTNPNFVLSGIN